MTITEVGVIVIGLFAGYWIISAVWPKPKLRQTDTPKWQSAGESERRPLEENQRNDDSPQPWHEVLGVFPTATIETIRSAYQSLMSKNHPDRVAHMSVEIQALAAEMTQKINVAYQQACKERGVQ